MSSCYYANSSETAVLVGKFGDEFTSVNTALSIACRRWLFCFAVTDDDRDWACLTAIFHDNPHIPVPECLRFGFCWSWRWWRCWWQLELWDAQSSSHIVTAKKPTPGLLQAGCPSCHRTNSVKALKGKCIAFQGIVHPKLTWGSVIDHWMLLVTCGWNLPSLSTELLTPVPYLLFLLTAQWTDVLTRSVLLYQLAGHGSYSLSQLCIKRGSIEFLKSLASETVIVSVEGTDFSASFTPVSCKCTSLTSLFSVFF